MSDAGLSRSDDWMALVEERKNCWGWFVRGLGVCGAASVAVLLAMAVLLL